MVCPWSWLYVQKGILGHCWLYSGVAEGEPLPMTRGRTRTSSVRYAATIKVQRRLAWSRSGQSLQDVTQAAAAGRHHECGQAVVVLLVRKNPRLQFACWGL